MKTADDHQHLHDLLEGFDEGMFTTRTQSGLLRSRPMAVADVTPANVLFFVTAAGSPKVAEIEADPRVNVALQRSNRFVSMSGTARVRRDPALVERLWKEAWRVWFPEGKDDPELVLVEVQPKEAEFWDNGGSRGLRYLFEATKAYLAGTTPEPSPDEHAKVRL
jgi:general stress protein 26